MKAFKHLKTIIKHKHWVFYYCCKAGIPFRGLIHDLSKFSPIEFFESAKYYTGTHSPIDEAKADKGYSKAWLHHRGRNKHHYEYWVDYLESGGLPILMPYKYTVEMMCDYLGAARAYLGAEFSYEAEMRWWVNKSPQKMHEVNKEFITQALGYMVAYQLVPNKKVCKKLYKKIYDAWKNK